MKLTNPFKKVYMVMVWEMAVAEFRIKDQGTVLGFLWTLLHPLIYFFVLYGLFVKWMGNRIPNFPLYLIIGIVQWNFFCSGTQASINAIREHSSIIKSIMFPKSILIISSVLSVLFSHLLELVILVVFWILIGEKISFTAFGLIAILLINVYLVISVSFVLAVIGVYFLDIFRIWGIITSVGLFLTPIFYSLDMLAPAKRRVILLNPMTHIIKTTRVVLIDNKMPEMSGVIYVLFLSTIIMIIGYVLFKKNEIYFVERI